MTLRWILLVLGLMVASTGAGWFMARDTSPKAPPKVHARPPSAGHQASERAAELSVQADRTDRERLAVLAAQESAAIRNGGAIRWDAYQLLLENKGSPVVVEGQVQGIDRSNSGKTIYLLFGLNGVPGATRAAISRGDATTESMIEKCESFLGKKIRVSGKVTLQKTAGLNRPDIMIDDLSAIKLVE